MVTPTGAPVIIEEWAMPKEDEAVRGLFNDFDRAFKNPGSLAGKSIVQQPHSPLPCSNLLQLLTLNKRA